MQITKSVNSEGGKEGKASDTMGMKHRVEFGLYVINGSINCQLAEKTGFTDEDAEKIKQALLTLFENDTSSARPDGSMEVCCLYWWKHEGKTPKYSSAKVHRQLEVKLKEGVSRPASFCDYDVKLNELDGLSCEKYEDLI
jgi:CRISPR-associated protein Csd2